MRLLTLLFFTVLSWPALANDPEAVFPIRIINEHIYFQMSVNDSEPLNFVFDTGAAGNVMAEGTAKKLELEINGRQSVQGASGTTTIERSTGHSMQIEDLNFRSVDFMVMNLDHLEDEDAPLDGIVGAEILRKYVVEINYDESVIKLYPRRSYKAQEGWEKQRMSLQNFGIPIVSATITLPNGETLTGPYLVDTGAATTVKFNTPFVNKNELINQLGKHYAYSSRTLSKTATDEVSRLPAYEVFGHKFEDFSVRLSQGKNGVSGLSQVDGILGLSILKRFNTVYDYYNQVMYLSPSKYYDNGFRMNHDGLKIEKSNGTFKVVAVFDDSPAQAAGLQVDDIILSLDGKNDFTRHEFHHYFQEAGKAVALVIQRDGKEQKIRLKPKAML